MEVLARINSRFASLSRSEQRVAHYVQRHPEEVVSLSLQALASKCNTSDATVLRFCRALGYSGFQDLKSSFIPELLRRGAATRPELQEDEARATYLSNLSHDVRRTLELLDEAVVERVAAALVNSRRIVLVGLAGSAGVARIFGDSLFSVGLIAICLSDRVEIERMSDAVGPEDVIFGISHSGETPEVYAAIERGGSHGAVTVGMTNFSPSSLEHAAEHVLLTSVAESLLGSYSCHPRVLELILLEMLLASVAKQLSQSQVPRHDGQGASNFATVASHEGDLGP